MPGKVAFANWVALIFNMEGNNCLAVPDNQVAVAFMTSSLLLSYHFT